MCSLAGGLSRKMLLVGTCLGVPWSIVGTEGEVQGVTHGPML